MIYKQVNVAVLDKTADTAIVKEYRADEDVFVFDLAETVLDQDGNSSLNVLASDRYEKQSDAPFTLTQEEMDELTGAV